MEEEKPAHELPSQPKSTSDEAPSQNISYEKETLLAIRSSLSSKTRPESLHEDFLNDEGIWDPEEWHTSTATGTSSPAIEITDHRRKEHVDDGYELAPHRRSFRQGCHVSARDDTSGKYNTRTPFEKKSRLTGRGSAQPGRGSTQRKNIESTSRGHGDSNYSDGNLTGRGSAQRKNTESTLREHGDSNYSDGSFEKTKAEKYATDKDGRSLRFDKYNDKENRQVNKERKEGYSDAVRGKEYEQGDRRSKHNRSSHNIEKEHSNLRGGEKAHGKIQTEKDVNQHSEKDHRNQHSEKDHRNQHSENDHRNQQSEKDHRKTPSSKDLCNMQGAKSSSNTGKEKDQPYRQSERYHPNPKNRQGREIRGDNLPEWMTDGPTSQLDTMEFTGFQHIEEEKKAYAKNKKVLSSVGAAIQTSLASEGTSASELSPPIESSPIVSIPTSQKSPPFVSIPTSKRSPPIISIPTSQISAATSLEELEKVESTQGCQTIKRTSVSKSPRNFNITDFFSEVNFYPPPSLQDDPIHQNRSRFSQYFQSKSRSSSCTSDQGEALLPEEIFSVENKTYFTPIQPAAPDRTTATPDLKPPPFTSPHTLTEEQAPTKNVTETKEIKGKLNVEELELLEKHNPPASDGDTGQSAFDFLVKSMKDAGQLPDKPVPVVTPLPENLFSKAPQKPPSNFATIKHTLNPSPSPIESVTSVSTTTSALPTNTSKSNETVFVNSRIVNSRMQPPQDEISNKEGFQHADGIPNNSKLHILSLPRKDGGERGVPIGNHARIPSFSAHAPQPHQLAFLPTSVLKKMHSTKQKESAANVKEGNPDKTRRADSPFSRLLADDSVRSPNLLSESFLDAGHDKLTRELSPFDNILTLTGQLNLSSMDKHKYVDYRGPSHSPTHTLHNHSVNLPSQGSNAPGQRLQSNSTISQSTLHRPINMQSLGLASLQKSTFTASNNQTLMRPSAFQPPVKQNSSSHFGVIGSGIPQKGPGDVFQALSSSHDQLEEGIVDSRLPLSLSDHEKSECNERRGFADPRHAPGNGVIRNTHSTHNHGDNLSESVSTQVLNPHSQSLSQSYSSQQHELLQAHRLNHINHAHLHQQQKLLQMSNQAKVMQQKSLDGKQFAATIGVGPLLSYPGHMDSHGQQVTGEGEHQISQRRQQIQEYQQQQPPQQQQQQQQQQQDQQQQKQQQKEQQQQEQQPQEQQQQQQQGHQQPKQQDQDQEQQKKEQRPSPQSQLPPQPPPPLTDNLGFKERQFQQSGHHMPSLPTPLHQSTSQAFQSLTHPQGFQNADVSHPQGIQNTNINNPQGNQDANLANPQGIQNVNLAAQALVQQQLLNQAARARFIAQTQLLQQQQPHVMQALMAQAALVRGQAAQAQATMMNNQRNLLSMREKTIRPPLPHINKHLPTPMLNTYVNHSVNQNPYSNNTTTAKSFKSQNTNVPSSGEGLSKWFGKDMLNSLPQNNPLPTQPGAGKVMSVEELERKQHNR